MIRQYIKNALRHAEVEKLEDGTYYAKVPGLDGPWGNAKSRAACLDERDWHRRSPPIAWNQHARYRERETERPLLKRARSRFDFAEDHLHVSHTGLPANHRHQIRRNAGRRRCSIPGATGRIGDARIMIAGISLPDLKPGTPVPTEIERKLMQRCRCELGNDPNIVIIQREDQG